jgi:hypothetical protein
VAWTSEVDTQHTILNAKKDTLAQLSHAVELKAQRQQQIMQQLSPAILVERLNDAAAIADGESEEIASTFLDGIIASPNPPITVITVMTYSQGTAADGDYKDFIKKFTEKRKMYHLRAAKKESTLLSLNQKR